MDVDPVDVHLPRFAPLLRRAHEMVKTNALIRKRTNIFLLRDAKRSRSTENSLSAHHS